ncbi:hypothetical protein [Limosilactobacillus allomucosae]|uniref:hypothetical protein n=1 Tax=Limosilactobacillus allomucosae TaxID=3142938 RepID=UPI003267A156
MKMMKMFNILQAWNAKRVIKTLRQQNFVVAFNDVFDDGRGKESMSFDQLMKEFWIKPKIVNGEIGFWQIDCQDWYMLPQKVNKSTLVGLINQLIDEIIENSIDVDSIICC